jgi:secreted trypsin-like serine protease
MRVKIPKRVLAALVSIAALLAVPSGVAAADSGGFSPYIIGGHAASEPYPGMASLQVDLPEEEDFHFCGASLVSRRYLVTNAHCVTDFDGSPVPPSLLHARIGSPNRLEGGVVVGIEKVLPHPDWDWAEGDNRVADIALLRLDTDVQVQPFEIAPHLAGRASVTRLIGWGITEASGEGPLPLDLQELDTRLLPPARCAAAFISEGELCVRNPNGTDGVCNGDSGGPALQKVGSDRWSVVGGTSRAAGSWCGVAPAVYTDLTYYRAWMYATMRTGSTSPSARVSDRNAPPHRNWIISTRRG